MISNHPTRMQSPTRHKSIRRRLIATGAWLLASASVACSGDRTSSPADTTAVPPSGNAIVPTVTVDTLRRFQTMSGWEAVAQIGHTTAQASSLQRDSLFDRAVWDLGINRLRLEIRSGAENSVDYYANMRAGQAVNWAATRYATVNDNNDPNTINPNGFHFTDLDEAIDNIVLPMRVRLLARGERLRLSLCYVGFVNSSVGYVHEDPAEYAELLLATFKHLQAKYGFVPDAVEMILEPDNTSMWRGTLIGRAMVATAARLGADGFHPEFIAPSNTNMANAITYFDEMMRVAGAEQLVTELSYHRYSGVSDQNLAAIADRVKQHGVRSAMLERIASNVEDLYKDLTIANASAWEQYTLAFPTGDDGAQYFVYNNGVPVLAERSRYLRQYFRYVRLGAVRIGAESDSSEVRPVAFQHTNGAMTVVMHLSRGGDIVVRGLRPGTYGASLTSASRTGQELGTFTATAAAGLRLSAPYAGVLALYRAVSPFTGAATATREVTPPESLDRR